MNTLTDFKLSVQEDGFRVLAKGWAPTFVGYSLQGMCKFGFYEVFKILYWNTLGEARPCTTPKLIQGCSVSFTVSVG